MSYRRSVDRALLLLPAALPGAAFAHSPIAGINEFYNGLLHPIIVPAHLLLLLALGLLLGQRGPRELQPAIFVYAGAVLLGLGMAWFSVSAPVVESLILGTAAISALLVAAALRLPIWGYAVICALAGLLMGVDSTQEALSGQERFLALLGTAVCLWFLPLYPLALAETMEKREWPRIGIRILGSWVAASAVMVFSLSLLPRQP